LLDELMHAELGHIVLGHLSENSNRPDVALSTVRGCLTRHEQLMRERAMTLVCGEVARPTALMCVGEPVRAAESA
jgi:hypothetical protein